MAKRLETRLTVLIYSNDTTREDFEAILKEKLKVLFDAEVAINKDGKVRCIIEHAFDFSYYFYYLGITMKTKKKKIDADHVCVKEEIDWKPNQYL